MNHLPILIFCLFLIGCSRNEKPVSNDTATYTIDVNSGSGMFVKPNSSPIFSNVVIQASSKPMGFSEFGESEIRRIVREEIEKSGVFENQKLMVQILDKIADRITTPAYPYGSQVFPVWTNGVQNLHGSIITTPN